MGDPAASWSWTVGRQEEDLAGKEKVRVGTDDGAVGAVYAGPIARHHSGVRGPERGRRDFPQRVLIVLMTSALIIAIWGVARNQLVDIVSRSLDTVCGSLGC
jgi:hypothetical protein